MRGIFEIIMLVCFGLAWPFSIYKSWKTREVGSKSFIFLLALLIGYVAGVIHKLLHSRDFIILLYILNGLMVATEIILYFRNRLYHIRRSGEAALQETKLPEAHRRFPEEAPGGKSG